MQEFESIREFFTSATISSLIDLPFALMFLLIIWLVAGPLAPRSPLVAVTLLIIFSLLIQRPLRQTIEEAPRLSSQKHANLIESLIGLETVKMFGAPEPVPVPLGRSGLPYGQLGGDQIS